MKCPPWAISGHSFDVVAKTDRSSAENSNHTSCGFAAILDGPPGVTAVINPAKVVPRTYSCSKPVAGGKLVLSAKDIHEHSYTRMVLRIHYKTLNGDREHAENLNIALFPSE